jgi:phosphatidyl-myo-inositol dimannoside synthase
LTRTLWVTNDFPPRAGGIEQFLANLVGRLDPAATVVVTHEADAAAHDAALPYRVDRRGRRPLLPTHALLRRIRRAVDAHRAEVVVFGASWPLGELAGALDVPTFALSHGHEAGMARVGLGPLVRRVARRVDALGVTSDFTREALTPWTEAETQLVDLPPGVDVDAFHPGAAGAPVRERHGIAADEPLVVCVSRLVHRKGQDVLVEAWPRVRARVPGARLLLVGEGPLEVPLRRRIGQLGLDGSVLVVGGVGWSELPGYHAAGDVFAMPCRTRAAGLDVEGLGIVYLEAQACGVPVVAGRSGGAPSALVEGETGRVVDGRSPGAVTVAIAGLLADPERRAEMGRAGRRFVEERYAWPVISKRLEAVLQALAAGRTPSDP